MVNLKYFKFFEKEIYLKELENSYKEKSCDIKINEPDSEEYWDSDKKSEEEKIKEIVDKIDPIFKKVKEYYSKYFNSEYFISKIKEKFEKSKKEIVMGKENIYIIDTNVFVDHPDIISKIDSKYSIVLSAKVIDELDYLKISLTDEQKKNVQKSLRLINESIDKRGVKMDKADLTLLPNDFNKKSPDNFILSVALKYKNENPIMLTSDNGLQIKAKGLGITTITLKAFLNQRKY